MSSWNIRKNKGYARVCALCSFYILIGLLMMSFGWGPESGTSNLKNLPMIQAFAALFGPVVVFMGGFPLMLYLIAWRHDRRNR